MREFAAGFGPEVAVLTREEVLERVPVAADGIAGGLWAPLDCRVDPREAVPAIARWLAGAHGVRFAWGATVLGADPGRLHTSRGDVAADAIVLAAGHDLDRLLPGLAEEAGLERCALQMLRVAAPNGRAIAPAVLTGLALLRYRGFARCPSLPAVRERLARERPDLLAADVNLMLTQRPDGDLVIGDTHVYARTPAPFRDERLDDLVLAETEALLGSRRLRVRERWQGVYAHAPGRDFLVAAPAPGVRAVAVTSGIGMTTALGLAPRVLDDLLSETT
jgi:FAD dependent oxidoreductase TIGR03364